MPHGKAPSTVQLNIRFDSDWNSYYKIRTYYLTIEIKMSVDVYESCGNYLSRHKYVDKDFKADKWEKYITIRKEIITKPNDLLR